MIWNPWRRCRQLQQEVQDLKGKILVLDHALRQSSDRYDSIRDANAQLRDALSLYRKA